MAEGILTHMSNKVGLDWTIDSAGTSGWHNGEQPDQRAIRTCRERGIDISSQRSRQISQGDLNDFDLILAMDANNLDDIHSMAGGFTGNAQITLITDLAEVDFNGIPDPYYDGRFGYVFDLLWETCTVIVGKYW